LITGIHCYFVLGIFDEVSGFFGEAVGLSPPLRFGEVAGLLPRNTKPHGGSARYFPTPNIPVFLQISYNRLLQDRYRFVGATLADSGGTQRFRHSWIIFS
jgi:hypothetical protein